MRTTIVYVLAALVGFFLLAQAFSGGESRKRIDLVEYKRFLQRDQVATAELYDRDNLIKGELENGDKFEIKYPAEFSDEVTQMTVDAGVRLPVDNQKESLWLTLLFNFAPFVLIIAVIAFFMNQAQGGGNRVMSFGKAKPKMVTKDTPKVSFADVAGVDEAIEELQEIKDFLEAPQKFRQMGAKIPKGV
ncbi:MAG: ATP-dependent metallopeptidase FtsH/Yme1/Tma family protein, partial [Acidimicrobiia bacterium]